MQKWMYLYSPRTEHHFQQKTGNILEIYITFLFIKVNIKVVVIQSLSHVQLFGDPIDYSPPGSSV